MGQPLQGGKQNLMRDHGKSLWPLIISITTTLSLLIIHIFIFPLELRSQTLGSHGKYQDFVGASLLRDPGLTLVIPETKPMVMDVAV